MQAEVIGKGRKGLRRAKGYRERTTETLPPRQTPSRPRGFARSFQGIEGVSREAARARGLFWEGTASTGATFRFPSPPRESVPVRDSFSLPRGPTADAVGYHPSVLRPSGRDHDGGNGRDIPVQGLDPKSVVVVQQHGLPSRRDPRPPPPHSTSLRRVAASPLESSLSASPLGIVRRTRQRGRCRPVTRATAPPCRRCSVHA